MNGKERDRERERAAKKEEVGATELSRWWVARVVRAEGTQGRAASA